MTYTAPVCGWLFPMSDPYIDEGPTIEEMATALAEMEAAFPSDEFDQAVGDYLLLPDHDLLQVYRLRFGS